MTVAISSVFIIHVHRKAPDSGSQVGKKIQLKILRLEVSVLISLTIGKVVWFSIRFSSFLLYSVQ